MAQVDHSKSDKVSAEKVDIASIEPQKQCSEFVDPGERTFTGKAAFVLENKLDENCAISAIDYVGTIHGLLYSPIYKRKNGKKIIAGWSLKSELEVDLIIVDEGSMVSKES